MDATAEQRAEAVFGERIEVGLVGVDVWVTDGDGRRVTGLGPADFVVRRDGEPVEVTHFSEMRGGRLLVTEPGAPETPPAEVAAPPTEPDPAAQSVDLGGHMVVYFDQLRLSPAGARAVAEALDVVLATGQVAPQRILMLRQDERLNLELPFGSDATAVRTAVERVRDGAASGLSRSTELALARDDVLAAWEWALAVSGSGRGAACERFRHRAELILKAWTRERSSRVAKTLENLDAAGGLLAGLPGAKSLVYVSDGLDLAPGTSLTALAAELCPEYGGEWQMGAASEGMSRQFLALATHLNAHGVTLHALQASGLRGDRIGGASQRATQVPAGADARYERRQRQAARSGMGLLAQQTGGREIYNRGDLAPVLADIGGDLDHYYSMAFPAPPGAGPVHDLDVELAASRKQPGWTLRYRRTVRSPQPGERVDEGLAGALHLGIVRNPLALSLGVVEATAEGAPPDAPPLSLQVAVPLDRLFFVASEEAGGEEAAEAAGEEWARLELRALALGTEGSPPVQLSEEFRLRRPTGTDVSGQTATLPLPLPLPPGPHRLAVALHDVGSGETSFVVTVLEVPPAPSPAG